MRSKESESGSAVIEATISFTAFIIVITIIYSVINFCVAESQVRFALEATVKEVSTYGYVYKFIGLDGIEASAGTAKDQINSVVDDYRSIQQIATRGSATSDDLTTVSNAGESMSATVESIRKNPLEAIKNFGSLAWWELGNGVRNTAVDAIVRALVEKNLNPGDGKSAHEYLLSLGVKDGLDGLEFSAPNFLRITDGGATAWSINLSACYYVEPRDLLRNFAKNVLNVDTTVHVCSYASTKAWVGDLAGKAGG